MTPQENYNREDSLHSNRRRSESSMALEEERRSIVIGFNNLNGATLYYCNLTKIFIEKKGRN